MFVILPLALSRISFLRHVRGSSVLPCVCGRRRLTLIILEPVSFVVLGHGADTQADFLLGLTHLDDLEIHLLPDRKSGSAFPSIRSAGISELWHSPSTPGATSTNTPKLDARQTFPRTISPT